MGVNTKLARFWFVSLWHEASAGECLQKIASIMLLVIHLVVQSTDLIRQSQVLQLVTVNDGMTPVYLS